MQSIQFLGLAPVFGTPISGFSNVTGTSVATLEAEIARLQSQISSESSKMSTLDKTLTAWSNEITADSAKIRTLESEIAAHEKEVAFLASVRPQAATTASRMGKQKYGEYCKNAIIGWNSACLNTNTAKQNGLKTQISSKKATIATLTKRVTENRTKILKAEKDMVAVRERINSAQVSLNDSIARLEEAKGNNNVDVLAKKAALEDMKKQLAQMEANAHLRQELVAQESKALEASIDMKKSTVPMLIGFAVLVAISLIYKYFFKGKI